MKAMDEFGSVLAMAALVLGVCAAVDEISPSIAAGPASADRARAGYGAQKAVAVARVAPAAQRPLVQQTRWSW